MIKMLSHDFTQVGPQKGGDGSSLRSLIGVDMSPEVVDWSLQQSQHLSVLPLSSCFLLYDDMKFQWNSFVVIGDYTEIKDFEPPYRGLAPWSRPEEQGCFPAGGTGQKRLGGSEVSRPSCFSRSACFLWSLLHDVCFIFLLVSEMAQGSLGSVFLTSAVSTSNGTRLSAR